MCRAMCRERTDTGERKGRTLLAACLRQQHRFNIHSGGEDKASSREAAKATQKHAAMA